VSVENRWWTLSTSVTRAEISVTIDGVPFWKHTATIDVPPRQRQTITYDDIIWPSEGEVTATIRWIARREMPWATNGQIVAWDQTMLRSRRWHAPLSDPSGTRPPAMIGLGDLSLWRAPTDNDGQRSGPLVDVLGPLRRWRRWGLEHLEQRSDTIWVTGDGTEVGHHRSVMPIVGGVRIVDRIDIPDHLDDVPRVSIHLRLPARFDRLRWFGRGPWETASDRRAAPLGIWESSVDEEYIAYTVPQHHGTHIDTRWLELSDANGDGVRITLRRPASFDVSRYAPSVLTAARTQADLVNDDVVHLHLDAALRGVGTGACGPDTSITVPTGRHQLEWCATQVSSKSSRSRSIARPSRPPASTR
jgi:beta-galactosidase